MKIQTLLSKLNWRLILVHFVATWFVMNGCTQFAYLYNIEFIKIFLNQNSYYAFSKQLMPQTDIGEIITYFIMWYSIAYITGFVISVTISLIVGKKNHWHWTNTIIIFVSIFTLNWFELTGWIFLEKILLIPGHFFQNLTVRFIFNGTLLITAGLLLFFLPVIRRFINNLNKPDSPGYAVQN